jgi:16S rRNA processing protein RimM
MIDKDNCILLGTLSKPYGVKGSFLIKGKNLKADEIINKESVFIEIDGLLVPFLIKDFQIKSPDVFIIKLEGIDSETKAREFSGMAVYMMQEQFKRKSGTVRELPDIRNYRVIDERLGFVGLVSQIVDLISNPLLVLKKDEKEYYVPMHEDIVREVNDKDKMIRISAPDGLFDI